MLLISPRVVSRLLSMYICYVTRNSIYLSIIYVDFYASPLLSYARYKSKFYLLREVLRQTVGLSETGLEDLPRNAADSGGFHFICSA
jgi:hypothetical protein